jgi:hypothetical protein
VVKKDLHNAHYMTEAMILRQLDHPNVLKLYAIFEDTQNYYLATEYSSSHSAISKEAICSPNFRKDHSAKSKFNRFSSKSSKQSLTVIVKIQCTETLSLKISSSLTSRLWHSS